METTSAIPSESLRSHAPAASSWAKLRRRLQTAFGSLRRASAGPAKGSGILILPRVR